MKTAILGVGTIVPGFLESASMVKEIELYALFGRERNISVMQKLQKQYGITKLYHRYEDVLQDEEIETVYVALPNHLHYRFAKQALEHKKNVIIEKPFASTREQTEDLIRTAKENQVFILEAIINQYMPNYEKAKEMVKELGTVKIVQLNFSQYSRRYDLFKEGTILPVFDVKKSGGALMDLNVYNIYYVLGVFGKPKKINYIANIERGVDTSGILTMEYDGFQCVCVGAKDCKAQSGITIQGDKGYLHSDGPANAYASFEVCKNSGECKRYEYNGEKPRMYFELAAIAEIIIKKDTERFEKAAEQSLQVMEILDEARRQAGIKFGGKMQMEQFELREVRPEEADEVAEIEQICFPPNEACSISQMKARVQAAPEVFLVAVDKETGRIAGFLNGLATDEETFRDEFFKDAGMHKKDGKNIMLLGLDVRPEYRGRGLAREIVSEYQKREKERNRKNLILTCLDAKVRMYEKMGFTDLGTADSTWGGEEWHEMSCAVNE